MRKLSLFTYPFHKIRGALAPHSITHSIFKPGFAVLSAFVLVTTSITTSVLSPPKASAADLPMKTCLQGMVPSANNNEVSFANTYGAKTVLKLENTSLLTPVHGRVETRNGVSNFSLAPSPAGSLSRATYDMSAQLIHELPYMNGFSINVTNDINLLVWRVESTMCPNDEYIWSSGVSVEPTIPYRPTSIEPKTGSKTTGVFVRLGRPVPIDNDRVRKVSMDYYTTAGSATAGKDFTHVRGVVTFNEGEQVKWVNVPILADSIAEGTENFTVTFNANPSPTNLNTTNVVNPVSTVTVPIYDTPPVAPPAPANVNPTAAFTWSRKSGAGNLVAFNSSSSKDSDGYITGWRWVMNGAVLSTAASPTLSLGPGTSKTITLTVTDNKGGSASVTKTLSLPNRAPRVVNVSPRDGETVGSNTPALNAYGADDDGGKLHYSYRVTGPSVDVSSGWVNGAWTVPPHRLDPGTEYQLVSSVKDETGLTGSRTTRFRVAALPVAADVISTSTGNGYWQVASDGGVFSYGDAQFYGSLPGLGIRTTSIMGMARTPSNAGYWLVGTDGGVFAFGDAVFAGSLPGLNIRVNNIVGMAPTNTGKGYWLVGADGGVYAFGDAPFYGSMGGQHLNAPVVAMSPTPSGKGYWLAAKDGGIFAFGDAQFYGSMGGQPLNAPVTDMDTTPDGKGYWMTAEDGGVFAFGNAQFFGSMAGKPLNGHITGMSATANGKGYYLNGCDGGIFAFGNAPFRGSNPTYQCRGSGF